MNNHVKFSILKDFNFTNNLKVQFKKILIKKVAK